MYGIARDVVVIYSSRAANSVMSRAAGLASTSEEVGVHPSNDTCVFVDNLQLANIVMPDFARSYISRTKCDAVNVLEESGQAHEDSPKSEGRKGYRRSWRFWRAVVVTIPCLDDG
jgi:hypothetical protein